MERILHDSVYSLLTCSPPVPSRPVSTRRITRRHSATPSRRLDSSRSDSTGLARTRQNSVRIVTAGKPSCMKSATAISSFRHFVIPSFTRLRIDPAAWLRADWTGLNRIGSEPIGQGSTRVEVASLEQSNREPFRHSLLTHSTRGICAAINRCSRPVQSVSEAEISQAGEVGDLMQSVRSIRPVRAITY